MYTNTIITDNLNKIPNYIPFSKDVGISIEFNSEVGRPMTRRFYYDYSSSKWKYYNGPLVYEITSMSGWDIRNVSYGHDFFDLCYFNYIPTVI